MYTSELHNAKESKEILEKGSPDIFVKWYHKKKKGPIHHPGVNTVKKSRLDQLEGRMGRFEGRMGRIEELIAKLAEKIDNLGNDLRNEMNTGFKQVNTRMDNLEKDVKDINARLDYIVEANNLKDSK